MRKMIAGLAIAAAAVAIVFLASLAYQHVSADNTHGGSVEVAIIGSPVIMNGGELATAGGDFDDFNFYNTTVAGLGVNAENLGAGGICGVPACDTLVLNVASAGELNCSTAGLTAAQKIGLNAFVNADSKMIIYDSECTPSVDYSWLTYPFTTTNPGALGAVAGTLIIADQNILSKDVGQGDPSHEIDTTIIATTTDAVGDMNVVALPTDPNWCLDMTGTNAIPATGAVRMYARDGAGVIIYNGLDEDSNDASTVDATGPGQLSKIWLLSLQAGTAGGALPAAPNCPLVSNLVVNTECYDIVGDDPPNVVNLETQFGLEENVEVGQATLLCPPALMDDEGNLEAPHLKCYDIVGQDPPDVVNLETQFGSEENVQVGQGRLLCAPALKEVVFPIPEPAVPPLLTAPHYECFEIDDPSPGVSVDLETQFGVESGVAVGVAQYLCAPALKNGEGNLAGAHLKCYEIAGQDPPHIVNLETQFGIEPNVDVGQAQLLCVPAFKEVAPTPTPPVGGIAELPDVSDSSGRNYMALAALAAAALVALTAGGWYARRRLS